MKWFWILSFLNFSLSGLATIFDSNLTSNIAMASGLPPVLTWLFYPAYQAYMIDRKMSLGAKININKAIKAPLLIFIVPIFAIIHQTINPNMEIDAPLQKFIEIAAISSLLIAWGGILLSWWVSSKALVAAEKTQGINKRFVTDTFFQYLYPWVALYFINKRITALYDSLEAEKASSD